MSIDCVNTHYSCAGHLHCSWLRGGSRNSLRGGARILRRGGGGLGSRSVGIFIYWQAKKTNLWRGGVKPPTPPPSGSATACIGAVISFLFVAKVFSYVAQLVYKINTQQVCLKLSIETTWGLIHRVCIVRVRVCICPIGEKGRGRQGAQGETSGLPNVRRPTYNRPNVPRSVDGSD